MDHFTKLWKGLVGLVDIGLILMASHLAYWVRFSTFDMPGSYRLFLLAVILVTIMVFSWARIYENWRGQWLFREISALSSAILGVLLIMTGITFFTKTGADFSRIWAGWTFVFGYTFMLVWRLLLSLVLRYMRSQGHNARRVVIAGAGALGRRACDTMIDNPWAGLNPVGFFDDDATRTGDVYRGVSVLGDLDDVVNYIEHQRSDQSESVIDHVWIALPIRANERIQFLRKELQNTAADIFFVPDLFEFNLSSYKVSEIAGLPVMNMSASPMVGGQALIKRLMDIILSTGLLLILSPLMLFVALAIKLDSPGPVIFKQRRYGMDGKEIKVWKFRSMYVTEDGADCKQATKNDARVTRVGSFLRKSSLDELPQLINVFLGSMSMVGPRPHPVALNEQFRGEIMGYMSRHQIRPGITGWAQVNGWRGETGSMEAMEQRIRHDLYYIRHWSVLLDMRILLQTVPAVLKSENAY